MYQVNTLQLRVLVRLVKLLPFLGITVHMHEVANMHMRYTHPKAKCHEAAAAMQHVLCCRV
jgi:hypothetical protein